MNDVSHKLNKNNSSNSIVNPFSPEGATNEIPFNDTNV